MARKAELARKFLDRGMQVSDARSKLPAVLKLLLEVYKLGAGIGLDLKRKNTTIISTSKNLKLKYLNFFIPIRDPESF